MYASVVISIAISVSLILPAENVRILAVVTAPGRSHWNYMSSVLRVLSENGHRVTVFTPFPDGDRDNYTEVDMSDEFPKILDMDLIDALELLSRPTRMIDYSLNVGRLYCDVIYENVKLKEIMRNGRGGAPDFDVIMVQSIGHRCVSYLAAAGLRLPMIYLISSTMVSFGESFDTGHVPNPATVSHLFADHDVPKTFGQRLSNAAMFAYSATVFGVGDLVKKYTEPKPYDSAAVRLDRPSLIFVNSHFVSQASRPFPPNVVQVGGVHLRPVKRLPTDILEFIENSTHGVILFTFGSIAKVSTLPDHIITEFKEAFAQLPQRVLWKYEEETENMPENIMIKKWLPQRDILMHPKVKLFISHGGMSGTYEAVEAGVPVLGFPLFYDQPKNIDNLVNAGMAISMDLLSVKKDEFLRNIQELVNNEKYMKKAKIACERFKDRPMSPQQSILYWTEYVVRHKGAPHLKSHAINLTWYQYLLMDVIAFILILVLVILVLLRKMYKFFYNFVRGNTKKNKTKPE